MADWIETALSPETARRMLKEMIREPPGLDSDRIRLANSPPPFPPFQSSSREGHMKT